MSRRSKRFRGEEPDVTIQLEPDLGALIESVDEGGDADDGAPAASEAALVRTLGSLKAAQAEARELRRKLGAAETSLAAVERERARLASENSSLVEIDEDAGARSRSAAEAAEAARLDIETRLGDANRSLAAADARGAADADALAAARSEAGASRKLAAEARAAAAAAEAEARTEREGRAADVARLEADAQRLAAAASKPAPEAAAAAEAATQKALEARAELEKERARNKQLHVELAGVRRERKSAAVSEERVHALERLLEKEIQKQSDHDAVRGARDALLGERAEWAKRFRALLGDDAGGDDAAVPRKALDAVRDALATARTADVSRLEAAAETARTRAALEAATAARGAAETRAAAAEARNADLEAGAIAWRAERALTRREHASLKELVATYGDEGDVDAALRARVGELEANLADAARALEAAAAAAAAAPRRAAAAAAEPAAAADDAGEFRVLHLVDNPAAAAAAAHALKKKAAEEARAKADEPKNVVDGAKLHARLKERFREHLSWFREAVYLLTGFKVDMSALGEDNPQVRLRSIFAEDEDDALLFAWGDDGVQLLATPFTDRLDERLFASLKFCNSVPAFLANVQLDLFEKQTLCPG